MNTASDEATQAARAAISSGFSSRPTGIRAMLTSGIFPGTAINRSVAM